MKTLEKLKIYGLASSVHVQRILGAVDELGMPYERFDHGHPYGGIEGAERGATRPYR